MKPEGHDAGDHAVLDSRTSASFVLPGAMRRRIAAPPYPTERCRGIRDRCNDRPDRRRAPAARTRRVRNRSARPPATGGRADRSEEHTSELQSLAVISYAVFCLKKKKNIQRQRQSSEKIKKKKKKKK